MPKNEYEFDDRKFYVEKHGSGWQGWFSDDPGTILSAPLKRDVLAQAGYVAPQSAAVEIRLRAEPAARQAPRRTMQDAYDGARERLAAGKFPKFNTGKPLSRFVILARDNYQCLYCEKSVETVADIRLDHIVPVDADGSHTAGNVATACYDCNHRKSNNRLADEAEWLKIVSDRNTARNIENDHVLESAGRF